MIFASVSKEECLHALSKAHEDKKLFELIETIINDHFAMVNHMKETSLWDVFMYEKHIVKGSVDPLRILTYENENLKKEVNQLRKKLGQTEKYKINI